MWRRVVGQSKKPYVFSSLSPNKAMTNETLLPWEAPAVTDIDLANETHGGGSIYSDESTFGSTPYNFTPGNPMS